MTLLSFLGLGVCISLSLLGRKLRDRTRLDDDPLDLLDAASSCSSLLSSTTICSPPMSSTCRLADGALALGVGAVLFTGSLFEAFGISAADALLDSISITSFGFVGLPSAFSFSTRAFFLGGSDSLSRVITLASDAAAFTPAFFYDALLATVTLFFLPFGALATMASTSACRSRTSALRMRGRTTEQLRV